jgi:hypothetical protein
VDGCAISLTQPFRTFHDGLKHSTEVGRGRGDDPQHLSRRGLLLQGLGDLAVAFPKLGVPLLDLLEQPRVLDGDHRLIGERLQQRDLPLGIWLGAVPGYGENADCLILSHKGHAEEGNAVRQMSAELSAKSWVGRI